MGTTPDIDAKGLLRSLYDFSFTSLITTKIIRFAYMVTVAILSLGAVILLLASLASGKAAGVLFGIVIVPLGYLLYLIMARIWMEFLIIVFRIGEDIRAMRISGGGLGGPPQSGGTTWGPDQPTPPPGIPG